MDEEEEEFDDQRIEVDNEWEKNLRDNDQHHDCKEHNNEAERPRSTENKEQKTISTMTTDTRTDWPQIDTSRMNIDDHAYVTPAPRAPRSGHRNDRPSERRDFDQDLQHSRDDPAIVMIGRPRDDILAEIRPSYWSAFPETTSTSLNPRSIVENKPDPESENEPDPESENEPETESENEPDPEITENENEPDISGYENTNQSAKARTCPNLASPMLTIDDQLQRRFPVSQFLQSRSRSRPTWPNSIHSIDHDYNAMTPDR